MTTWLPILGKAEELLLVSPKSTTSDSLRDSSPVSQAQNDKISNLQDKTTYLGITRESVVEAKNL